MAKQTKSVTNANGKAAPRSRNAARSRKAILQSALEEFSTKGYSGARIDEIAKRAAVSKPLIYEYFGDKDAIYEAALRETYVQIREGEKTLDMDELSPEDAIRSLVVFTMDHFRRNPWFISMLNTENLRGGSTVRQMGEIEGQFRSGIDAVELYIFIASLCYFPISNMHTLRSVFQCTVDDEWLERRGLEAAEMIVCYLKEANK
jgi:AcrR family transcriptional regulator